jgi:hypothetical protein
MGRYRNAPTPQRCIRDAAGSDRGSYGGDASRPIASRTPSASRPTRLRGRRSTRTGATRCAGDGEDRAWRPGRAKAAKGPSPSPCLTRNRARGAIRRTAFTTNAHRSKFVPSGPLFRGRCRPSLSFQSERSPRISPADAFSTMSRPLAKTVPAGHFFRGPTRLRMTIVRRRGGEGVRGVGVDIPA